MKPRILFHYCLLSLVLALPTTGLAATLEELLASYPLEAGSRWVHRHVRYDGIGGLDQNFVTRIWLSETRFVEQLASAQGILFVLETRGLEGRIETSGTIPAMELQRAQEGLEFNLKPGFLYFLFREGYLYEVPAWAVAAETKTISAEWLDRAETFDNPQPFPLANVSKFQQEQLLNIGESYTGFYNWNIAGPPEHLSVAYGSIEAAQLVVYPTMSGISYRWVKEGIGMVKEEYQHGGSYFGSSSELVEFTKQGSNL
jgi:hypothetical protein